MGVWGVGCWVLGVGCGVWGVGYGLIFASPRPPSPVSPPAPNSPSPASYSLRLIHKVGFPPLLFFHEILNLGAVFAQGFVNPDAIFAIGKDMD